MTNIFNRLDEQQREKLGEIIRFGIVGTVSTLIQAGTYCLLVGILNYVVANTIAYIVSFIFNYIASTKYTFRVKSTAKRGAGFLLSHVVNYLLQTATLAFFVWLGMEKRLALIPMFCICVPINFLLVRYFLKK
ncbi:MAG: GtrA family protein [Prevotella sp.]|jgi:putative flippase GtrA|nr:GtrA family protein [Prevotella sp.]